MKITIRRGTFETNSSSVHSLVLIPHKTVEEWKAMGDGAWLDLGRVEKDAENSGSGYGDVDGVEAVAGSEHLVFKHGLESEGQWREPAPYQDDIDANWMLPLDVIERPERYVDDDWCCIWAVEESNDGYLVRFD